MNKRNIDEIIIAQSKSRIEGSNKANEKAMDTDIERVLKQSDIIFTLNGFLLAILTIFLSEGNINNILLSFFAIILLSVQSVKLRNIRNEISMQMKQYLSANAEILIQWNRHLLNNKTTNQIQESIQNCKEEIDKLSNMSSNKIDSLVEKQGLWKYASLINFGIVVVMLFIKYNIWNLVIGSLCSK